MTGLERVKRPSAIAKRVRPIMESLPQSHVLVNVVTSHQYAFDEITLLWAIEPSRQRVFKVPD
jgi:hypothetical protein